MHEMVLGLIDAVIFNTFLLHKYTGSSPGCETYPHICYIKGVSALLEFRYLGPQYHYPNSTSGSTEICEDVARCRYLIRAQVDSSADGARPLPLLRVRAGVWACMGNQSC